MTQQQQSQSASTETEVQTTDIKNFHKQLQHETGQDPIPATQPLEHEPDLSITNDNTLPAPNFVANAQSAPYEPHRYLYAGATVILLALYAIYIFVCKWRKDKKNKPKPIKNQLIEEKVEESTTPGSGKMAQQVELVQMP